MNYFHINLKGMESRFSNIFCMLNFVTWRRSAVSADFFKNLWRSIRGRESWADVISAMFGAEPYQFESTYPPGEEPALHGEGEERSTSPKLVRIRNTDCGCICAKCISTMSEDECYFCQELHVLNENFDSSGLYSNCSLFKSWTI